MLPEDQTASDPAGELQDDFELDTDDVDGADEPEAKAQTTQPDTPSAPDPEKEYYRKQAEAAEARAREYENRIAEERRVQEQASAVQQGQTYLAQKRKQVIDAFAQKMAEKPDNEREALGTLVDQLIAVQAEVTAAQLATYHEKVTTQHQTQGQFLAQQEQRFLATFGKDEDRAQYAQPVTRYAAHLISLGHAPEEAEYLAVLRMDREIADKKKGKVPNLQDRRRPTGNMGESTDDASTNRGGGSVDENKQVAALARRLAGL